MPLKTTERETLILAVAGTIAVVCLTVGGAWLRYRLREGERTDRVVPQRPQAHRD